MPGPLPLQLRERAVQAYEDGEGSYVEVAARFCIGDATLKRWVARHRKRGTLAPDKAGAVGRFKVDKAGEQFIHETLEALPDSTLRELSDAYLEVFGVVISTQTMSDTVRRLGYTKKGRGSEDWLLTETTS